MASDYESSILGIVEKYADNFKERLSRGHRVARPWRRSRTRQPSPSTIL